MTDNWPESPFNKKTSNGTYDEEDAKDELNLYVGCRILLPFAHWIVSNRGPVLICHTCTSEKTALKSFRIYHKYLLLSNYNHRKMDERVRILHRLPSGDHNSRLAKKQRGIFRQQCQSIDHNMMSATRTRTNLCDRSSLTKILGLGNHHMSISRSFSNTFIFKKVPKSIIIVQQNIFCITEIQVFYNIIHILKN